MDVRTNWWHDFFSGVAVDFWIQAIPSEHTAREAETLERALAVAPGAELLDVPCGAGRMSLPLAARGYRMTAVDLSDESLAHARAADVVHAVAWEHRDMRDLPWPARFDGAFCVGNSFGYFDDEGDAAFLTAVASALKPGGRFVLETPMIAESLLPTLPPRPWYTAGDVYLLVTNDYDPARGRLDIEYTFVSNGRVETRRGSHRVYTYRQLVELVAAAGFRVASDGGWTRASLMTTLVGIRI